MVRTFIVILALVLVLASSINCWAAKISATSHDEPGDAFTAVVIRVEGEIQRGDAAELLKTLMAIEEFLSKTPEFSIFLDLNSPGGDVVEALNMVEMLRPLFLGTAHIQECSSACFYLLATTELQLGYDANSKIGIHRPHLLPEYLHGISAADAEKIHRTFEQRVDTVLKELNVSNDLIEKMMATPSKSVYWLKYDRLAKGWPEIFGRDPHRGFTEWMEARCGHIASSEIRQTSFRCKRGDTRVNAEVCRSANAIMVQFEGCVRRHQNPEQLDALRKLIKTRSESD